MFQFFAVLLFAATVYGGSICPPRENIYPCNCVNIHQSKKIIHTIVNCHRLSDSDVLSSSVRGLMSLQIDQFHLYDSFWEAHKLQLEDKKLLPVDWTSLRIKEMEITDTALASCFGCQGKKSCKASGITRFTAINSSSSEKFCLCSSLSNNIETKYSWTNCLSRLQHFQYSYSKLSSFGIEMFPSDMRDLKVLNLTHNQIAFVQPQALKNLQKLTTLDLSYNALEKISFDITPKPLQFLDLSWNNIKTLGPLMQKMPSLITIKLESNSIVELIETDWTNPPGSLREIDLSDNPLHCDCSIKWINSTFVVHVSVIGICASPDEFENSAIRTATRHLNQRCDEDGNIGDRTKKPATTPKF